MRWVHRKRRQRRERGGEREATEERVPAVRIIIIALEIPICGFSAIVVAGKGEGGVILILVVDEEFVSSLTSDLAIIGETRRRICHSW